MNASYSSLGTASPRWPVDERERGVARWGELPRRHARASGAAVILVLLLLVLLVVMVVSLLQVTAIDRAQSAQHLERVRASLFASEGVERAVAILQRETVNPIRYSGESDAHYEARQRNWASQPGLLVVPEAPPDLATETVPGQKQLRKKIELSSGVPGDNVTYAAPVLEPARLNIQLLKEQGTPTYLITSQPSDQAVATSQPPAMSLRWIYVRRDVASGAVSYDLEENPKLDDEDNPIVGRFAWWVDDESSKINYNLAWKRNPPTSVSTLMNSNPSFHPSKVNLMALKNAKGDYLSEPKADAFHTWTTLSPKRYFNSFSDARQLEGTAAGVSDFLRHNQFELTHYNHDPDITFFGEERILLTTNPDLVPRNSDGSFARRFLDIMRDGLHPAMRDPGNFSALAGGQQVVQGSTLGARLPNKFNKTMEMLMSYLEREDWPVAPGLNFKDKYLPDRPAGAGEQESKMRLAQLALNIIDYVRMKESSLPVVEPLRAGWRASEGGYSLHQAVSWDFNSMQGTGRAPLITEMAAYVENNPHPTLELEVPKAGSDGETEKVPVYPLHYRIEVHLPAGYYLDKAKSGGVDLEGWWISFSENAWKHYSHYWLAGGALLDKSSKIGNTKIESGDIIGGDGPNGTVLMPGKYVVIKKTYYTADAWQPKKEISLRVALFRNLRTVAHGLGDDTDWYPKACIFPQWEFVTYKPENPATIAISDIKSVQTDDPRAGTHFRDWELLPNTLGEQNGNYSVGKKPDDAFAALPQQDTDADGNISDYSLYVPPPKGVNSNGAGGDNGRVTSVGELGYVVTGTNTASSKTDTLRSVPWRTLRLQPNRYADSNSLPDWLLLDLFSVPQVPGQMNDHLYSPHKTSVGGRLNINSLVWPFTEQERHRPLVALLLGATGVSSVSRAEALAANIYRGVLSSEKNGSSGKAYGYPWGDSSQPSFYNTPGAVAEIEGVADDGEEGEERIRSIVSLITTKGGVFSVYTIGQALKQTPSGGLVVTGEQRMHEVIERFRNTFNSANDADHKVQFRKIYSRQL